MLLHILSLLVLLACIGWTPSLAARVPLCSLPSSARLSALPTLTTSRLAPSSPYAYYAETAYADYIREMYDDSPRRRWLRLQVGSNRPSNYWNTAIALHTLLQYNTFDVNRGGKDEAVQLVEQLVERERSLNESDPQLRNLYNDDMVRQQRTTALHDREDGHLQTFECIISCSSRSDFLLCASLCVVYSPG